MQRRELIRLLATAGATPLLAPLLARAAEAENWQADFEASGAPWKLGFASPQGDWPLAPAQVRGRFPDAVAGTLYRIGPAGHDLGGERYHHWFDGDGMVQRLVIEGQQVHHHGRYVATSKRVAEVRAGRRLTEAFGTVPAGVDPPTSADSINVANTSVLPLGGEVLALWEGGSAMRMDARTLDTLGLKSWRADLAGMPFSAHPKVDPDGTVWNFGVGNSQGLLALYEIAPDGQLRRAAVVPVPDLPMVHDFAVTDRHLVFLMPPLVYDGQRKAQAGMSRTAAPKAHSTAAEGEGTPVTFLDAHVWRAELGLRALVVDKKDWDKRQWFTLPSGFLFHVGNAWEEATPAGRRIHVDYVRSEDARSVFTTNRALMRGRLVKSPEPHLTVATLELGTGRATQKALPFGAEFPRIDPRRVGLRHRHVVHATQTLKDRPGFSAIARTDVETGRSQRFVYGPQAIVEEHVFVPDGQRPGWILGTVLDLALGKTVLSCFAADHLGAGPVAQAVLPRALPLGLHGAFVPA